MTKFSKQEQQKIKETLSKWTTKKQRYILTKHISPAIGVGSGVCLALDFLFTGGIGTATYLLAGTVFGGYTGWCVATDTGHVKIKAHNLSGQEIKGAGPALIALKNMSEKATGIFNEMSQKPEAQHAPYLKQLIEIEHDAQVIKPLYQVFNEKGQEMDKYEFQLQREEVKEVVVQEVVKKEINISDMQTPTKKVRKLGK